MACRIRGADRMLHLIALAALYLVAQAFYAPLGLFPDEVGLDAAALLFRSGRVPCPGETRAGVAPPVCE